MLCCGRGMHAFGKHSQVLMDERTGAMPPILKQACRRKEGRRLGAGSEFRAPAVFSGEKHSEESGPPPFTSPRSSLPSAPRPCCVDIFQYSMHRATRDVGHRLVQIKTKTCGAWCCRGQVRAGRLHRIVLLAQGLCGLFNRVSCGQ